MRRDVGFDPQPVSTRFPFALAVGLIFGACALNLAPVDLVGKLRSLVRDALAPAQNIVQICVTSIENSWSSRRPPSTDDADESPDVSQTALATRNRQLELELADLRERVAIAEEYGRRPKPTSSKPLLIPELIEANWLGEGVSALVREKGLLSVGSADGLTESAIVLQSELPLIDQGESGEIQSGDAVYAGRVVVGKIADVGRHTSTVRRVTDADFSGRARVARRTERGLEVIAEGTLVGDGADGCLLKHVTEPIAEGDEVYTSGTDGVLRLPMYYGRVVRAELEPAAREWTVVVSPAAMTSHRDRVQVLRLKLNRERVMAN
ncbi:MAG: hypothetical protein NT069_13700 [Planctomycetota bacterium]|nr:hypothetical protein [Planctomycetota bacterium]